MSEITKLGSKVNYSSHYDPSELEVFPRAPRRKDYTAPMYGIDIWTCYEVSFLKENGVPEYHVLRIANFADSENIFESKSLKLYLNSFNNTKFKGIREVISLIKRDLSERVGHSVEVTEIKIFVSDSFERVIDKELNEDEVKDYSYNSNLLEYEEVPFKDKFKTNLLRSNCEITNQPDWGVVIVSYEGPRKLNLSSFLKYIISYRNHQEFHEPTCERIYNDLYNLLQPELLTVICQYTRRGGIDINPIRSNIPLEDNGVNFLFYLPKRLQQ